MTWPPHPIHQPCPRLGMARQGLCSRGVIPRLSLAVSHDSVAPIRDARVMMPHLRPVATVGSISPLPLSSACSTAGSGVSPYPSETATARPKLEHCDPRTSRSLSLQHWASLSADPSQPSYDERTAPYVVFGGHLAITGWDERGNRSAF